MSVKKRLKLALVILLGLFAAMVTIGVIVGPAPKEASKSPLAEPSATEPVLQTNPNPVETTSPKAIAAAMTKRSPIHRIPWPQDASPVPRETNAISTRIGTVTEITSFYNDWMRGQGWTFDAKNSTLDPDDGVAKSLGYTSSQVWCKRTRPITTASIIVGSGDKSDHGKYAEIYVLNLPHEESCP